MNPFPQSRVDCRPLSTCPGWSRSVSVECWSLVCTDDWPPWVTTKTLRSYVDSPECFRAAYHNWPTNLVPHRSRLVEWVASHTLYVHHSTIETYPTTCKWVRNHPIPNDPDWPHSMSDTVSSRYFWIARNRSILDVDQYPAVAMVVFWETIGCGVYRCVPISNWSPPRKPNRNDCVDVNCPRHAQSDVGRRFVPNCGTMGFQIIDIRRMTCCNIENENDTTCPSTPVYRQDTFLRRNVRTRQVRTASFVVCKSVHHWNIHPVLDESFVAVVVAVAAIPLTRSPRSFAHDDCLVRQMMMMKKKMMLMMLPIELLPYNQIYWHSPPISVPVIPVRWMLDYWQRCVTILLRHSSSLPNKRISWNIDRPTCTWSAWRRVMKTMP